MSIIQNHISVSTINRLPEEILANVFEHIYYGVNERRKVTGYFRSEYVCWTTEPLWVLRRVCQKWRYVVQTACAVLWARICTVEGTSKFEEPKILPDPSRVLRQQLQFTKGCLLDIIVQFDPREDKTSPFSLLYALRSRWRSATIVFNEDSKSAVIPIKQMQLAAPELHYLKLDFVRGPWGSEHERIFPFNITSPKLRQVEVLGGLDYNMVPPLELPWDQLTHVSLASNNMRDILKYILLMRDNIQCLSILETVPMDDSIEFWRDEPRVDPTSDPIIFPRLRALELWGGIHEPGAYENFLDVLVVPELRSLAICAGKWPFGQEVAGALHRSRCKLEYLIMAGYKETHLSTLLHHAPHLLSLELEPGYEEVDTDGLLHQLADGPNPKRKLCPSLKLRKTPRLYASGTGYQPQIFDPPPRLV